MCDGQDVVEDGSRRTVGGHLVALDAVLAGETGDTGLLVNLCRNGVLRVTEDAFELGVQALALLGAGWLRGGLAFALDSVNHLPGIECL